jgi:AcrR family transcriptional regulator
MTTARPISLREAQKELTRTRMLDAAAALFATQGYAATTIDQIATAAGATRATFYLHFASKSDVVHGFYEALVAFDADYELLIETAGAPTQDAVRSWLDRFIAGLETQRPYWIALREAAGADPEARAAAEEDFYRSADLLAAGLARVRGWDADHAYLVAVVFKRQLDVCNDDWIRSRWDTERGRLLDALACMWTCLLAD